MYLIRPANTIFARYILSKVGILLVELYGSHTMKAYGELITHLISISKTKNYKSGLYLKHVVIIRPTIFLLNFTIKTLRINSNYQSTHINPLKVKIASNIHKILHWRLGFSILFRVKLNTLKFAFQGLSIKGPP